MSVENVSSGLVPQFREVEAAERLKAHPTPRRLGVPVSLARRRSMPWAQKGERTSGGKTFPGLVGDGEKMESADDERRQRGMREGTGGEIRSDTFRDVIYGLVCYFDSDTVDILDDALCKQLQHFPLN
ncbi:hypothetical protein Tco_0184639 [Tanacetum coccineum]